MRISNGVKIVLLVFIILLCRTSPVHALTLEEAVALARTNNHRVKEFRHLTQAQENRVGSERSAFWPALDLDYEAARSDSAFDFGSFAFEKQTQSAATATASYNLFSGLSDWYDVKSAQARLQASRYEQRAVEADVVLDAKNAFIEVLRAQQNLLVSREAVELLERQRRDAELQYRVGLTAKNELLRVEVELASAQQDLLRDQGLLRVARKALERVTGIRIRKDEAFEDLGNIESVPLREDQLAGIMYANRSELAALESLKQSREYTRRSIQGGYLPSIDLSVSYSQFGERLATDGRENLPDDETRTLVTATWNLFGGFKTTRDAAAERAEILAIDERFRDTKQELLLQLRTAMEVYAVSTERKGVAKKAIEQAEENYRITNNQFKQNVTDATKLLQARILLSRSRSEYVSSIYNHYRSIAAIERVIEDAVPGIKASDDEIKQKQPNVPATSGDEKPASPPSAP